MVTFVLRLGMVILSTTLLRLVCIQSTVTSSSFLTRALRWVEPSSLRWMKPCRPSWTAFDRQICSTLFSIQRQCDTGTAKRASSQPLPTMSRTQRSSSERKMSPVVSPVWFWNCDMWWLLTQSILVLAFPDMVIMQGPWNKSSMHNWLAYVCVYVYICMYVCMYVYLSMYVWVCMHLCIKFYVCLQLHA